MSFSKLLKHALPHRVTATTSRLVMVETLARTANTSRALAITKLLRVVAVLYVSPVSPLRAVGRSFILKRHLDRVRTGKAPPPSILI